MIDQAIRQISGPDVDAMRRAEEHLARLTKPPGSLGRLEALAIQLAGISGNPQATYPDKRVALMAADHGVVAEGVSAYPQVVTTQMVRNFLEGGAAINVLARQAGARVVCVDIGVAADLDGVAGLVSKKVARGTRNMRREPALSPALVKQALKTGVEVAFELADDGVDLLATGEMGIGNTTASSATLAALTGQPVPDVVGFGTGIAEEQWRHKVRVIEESLDRWRPKADDAVDVLSKVGGLELCGLAGLILGAAAKSIPVVLDGFISTVAALCAVRVCPAAKPYLIASHRSAEPGHAVALAELGLEPMVDADMRLGEGTGAALLFPIIDATQAIMREMATFSSAGVSSEEGQGR